MAVLHVPCQQRVSGSVQCAVYPGLPVSAGDPVEPDRRGKEASPAGVRADVYGVAAGASVFEGHEAGEK